MADLSLPHGTASDPTNHLEPAQPSSMSSTYSSAASSSLARSDRLGSISTQETSMSIIEEWQQRKASTSSIGFDPQITLPKRPKGHYGLSDFIIHRTLGTGSFGRVHLVRSKHNLRFYAIKVLSKEKVVRTKQVQHTNNEREMLEAVQHPFIVNLWGTFQDPHNLYMVMDFVAGGELFTLLRRSNRFPDPVAKFYAAEVALALNYLHSLNIIYRDLKPENVLIGQDGHIKIADFGFAKLCPNMTWTLCGTPDYLAPEVVNQSRYNKSVDWYALGVLIFEMLSGLPPYHQPEPNPVLLYERIAAGPTYIRWPAFHPNAKDLIMKLMESDPSRRYGNLRHGAGDVFAHPWFREVDWEKLRGREIMAPYMPKIDGDGDASAFENYPESEDIKTYGSAGEDQWGSSFPDFEYTAAP